MQGTGSVTGGECKLTPVAEYEVLGKTDYDQRWIDETTEGLIAGCNRPRPKARPADLDKPNRVITPIIKPVPKEKPRKRWFDRIRKPAVAGFVMPLPRPAPRPAIQEAQPEPAAARAAPIPAKVEPEPEATQGDAEPPAEKPAPKEPLDDLLGSPSVGAAPPSRRDWCLWRC